MRTTVLAYVIAAVGLLMLIFGAWGLLVLNNAEIDVALADEAIMVGAGRRRLCNDRSRASPASATRHCEKYQSSLGGSLKRESRVDVRIFYQLVDTANPPWPTNVTLAAGSGRAARGSVAPRKVAC